VTTDRTVWLAAADLAAREGVSAVSVAAARMAVSRIGGQPGESARWAAILLALAEWQRPRGDDLPN